MPRAAHSSAISHWLLRARRRARRRSAARPGGAGPRRVGAGGWRSLPCRRRRGALDGLLEPGQRRGDVRAGELLERLGRDVLVRAPPRRGHPLTRGDDQARRVLLGRDHDQRAAVELARCLGAVDELPQPGERGLRVALLAVVVAQPSAGALLARLGDVAAQLVEDEPNAAGGDPGDPLAGLRVRGPVVVGAQERVDELGRRRDYAEETGRRFARTREARANSGVRAWWVSA